MKKIGLKVLFVAIILSQGFNINAQNKQDLNTYITKFAQTIYYINNYYLDTVNNTKVIDEAIAKALGQLDPHSSYISAKDVKSQNEPLEGNFEGVGIEFTITKDTLTVANPISGGPCEKVGIRAGDKIIKVNGEIIASKKISNEKVFKFLRGPKGSKVSLTVIRRGVKEPLEFDVVRDKIPINSLDAAYEAEPGILYLKLSRFAATSYEELNRAIGLLKLQKVTGVILDLRGNGGGFLGTAFDVCNMFLEKGQMIVYTEGLRAPKMIESAKGDGAYTKTKLVVLIDESSASASEIVAGAVQDWDRGTVIGRRSFGKGLVQQMLPLNDGSQLRLTIARYHTPSGRVIQSPYEQGGTEKYYKAVYERYTKGELFNKDSIHFPDSLKYKTLIKGRTVYGGGGIMPDIFIPADTSSYSNYYGNLLRKGILTDFMNNQFDLNRDNWKNNYKTFSDFDKSFIVTDEMLESLFKYAENQKLDRDDKGIETSKNEIKSVIKALSARMIFGTGAYFRVVNSSNDKVYDRALEILKSK